MGLFDAFPYRILFYILIPYFVFLILIQLKARVTIQENFVDTNKKTSFVSNNRQKQGLSPLQKNVKRDDAEEERIKKQMKKVELLQRKNFVQEYEVASRSEIELDRLHKEINALKEELLKAKEMKSADSDTNTDTKTEIEIEVEPESEPVKQKVKEVKVSKEKIVVGCEKDADCNLFYGDGKNTCKSNNQCRCEIGAGVLCQRGPTHFKDPKDMTKKEKTIFKNTSNYDNFTIQDYKNWLELYNKDYYLLSDEHLINLRKVMRGEPLALRDIPTGGLRPPLTSQKYFAEMYDRLGEMEQIVSPINSSTTGAQVGYNYNEYSDFSPPNALPQLRVISGEIERKYRRPSAINKIFPVPLEDAIGPYQSNPAM